MASQFDESDFVDGDFIAQKNLATAGFAPSAPVSTPVSPTVSASTPMSNRPPSREEIESKVTETQARLAELRRAQEVLERERASLEEARRKRIEFQNGREEMLQHLTRGLGILGEAQFAASRNAEQMKQSMADMHSALEKVQAMREENWSEENWQQELTKALTTLENAQMEWNSARVKWTILDGALEKPEPEKTGPATLMGQKFSELCRLGFAFTWPIALVALLGAAGVIIALLAR